MSNKQTLAAALTALIGNKDLSAVDRYWDKNYIQHNPMMPDGSEILRMMIQQAPGFSAQSVRMIAEGDLVVVHNRVSGMGPGAIIGFEIFRVEDGKLVEHWDVQQPEVATTVSGRSQIDGPTEVTDLDKTAANKELVERFFDDVLYHHRMDKLTDYISTTTYYQHNPGVGNGLEGFGKAMAELAQQGLTMEYHKTYRIVAEGNLVLTHSEGIFAGKHVAFADLFRIADGKIVEHWDAIAEVRTEGARNDHGVF